MGKTLVAAAVVSNFARWFPAGLTVFLAPTRPLVTQQAAAIAAAVGAGPEACLELTGSVAASARAAAWDAPSLRHVFATPQAFANDLRVGAAPAGRITCVVVDECHRAVGKAGAAAAVRRLAAGGSKCRVVGLSATPGATREAVQEVVTTLGAARIEHRAEGDADLAPFVHARAADTVVVPSPPTPDAARRSAVAALRTCLREAGTGYRGPGDPASAPRATLAAAARAAAERAGAPSPPLALWLRAASLLAGVRDALDAYGLAAARDLLAPAAAAAAAAPLAERGDPDFAALSTAVAKAAGPGEGKLTALAAVLEQALGAPEGCGEGGGAATARPLPSDPARPRAIVFASLRESVDVIVASLRDGGRDARAFIGPGAARGAAASRGRGRAPPRSGMRQAEQASVLAAFRAGSFPVLVATCVGEEGLDVPSVDAVVGFDAAAPLRAAQRAGRTGRARPGRVVVLVEAGREEEAQKRGEQVREGVGAVGARAARLVSPPHALPHTRRPLPTCTPPSKRKPSPWRRARRACFPGLSSRSASTRRRRGLCWRNWCRQRRHAWDGLPKRRARPPRRPQPPRRLPPRASRCRASPSPPTPAASPVSRPRAPCTWSRRRWGGGRRRRATAAATAGAMA